MKRLDPDKPHQFFFETLGNKARWNIVHLLKKSPRRVTDIAKELRLEQSLVSHHLKRLSTCGFVHMEENGAQRTYALNKKTIGPLLALVERHVERFCKKACCR